MSDRLLGGLVLVALFLGGLALGFGEDDEFVPMSAPATPTRLVVPSLDLRAPVVPVRLDADGVLDPPDDERVVGWWKGSRRPGAEGGQTVLTGHTVHDGGGVMDRLGKLDAGERIALGTDAGRVVYEVERTETLTVAELAASNEEIFAQDHGGNRLVLITCTGWDGEQFTENVVVYAEQLGLRKQTEKRPGKQTA